MTAEQKERLDFLIKEHAYEFSGCGLMLQQHYNIKVYQTPENEEEIKELKELLRCVSSFSFVLDIKY